MIGSHGVAVTHESVAKFTIKGESELGKEDELAEELQNVFKTLQKCLEARHKYIGMSLQVSLLKLPSL